MKALIQRIDFTCRYGGTVVCDGWAGLVDGCSPWCWLGNLMHCRERMSARWLAVAWDNKGSSFRACVAYASGSSFTLSGGCRVPKSTMRGRASLCKHFPRLFAMRVIWPSPISGASLRNKLHLLLGGATESRCQGAGSKEGKKIGAIF